MRRLDNIDIRLLRVFVALADAGGFAEAQIALNLSQSTLSTHLAELEKRLGGQLCHRGRQQFRLTELGQTTYDAALELFRNLDSFTERVSQAGGGLAGRLRIGACDGVLTSPTLGIQHALARFMKPGSDVFVDLFLGTPSELERQLVEGARDIVIGQFSQRAPGIVYVPFAAEPHMLYCGRGHPLFGRTDKEITRKDIDDARFSVRSFRHFDDLYLAGHPKASASAVHMEAQLMLILSGCFIGFVPCHLAAPHVAAGELRAIWPRSFAFNAAHRVAYRAKDRDKPLVSAFVEILAALAKDALRAPPTESGTRWEVDHEAL